MIGGILQKKTCSAGQAESRCWVAGQR